MRIFKGGTPLPSPTPRARKGERKRNPSYEMVHVNGKKVGGNANISKFTAYVSPYFVVSNGGAYTKHIYAASQRIASKLGNEDGFGADPRRVEQAGGKKISDFQKGNVGERFKALGYEYSAPEKEKVEKDSTMDSEEEEKLIFFYHPDHLGSTSYVTDADGNIAQHVEYIPYGEVFVEERNNSFSTNYLFNAKELDNETGLYYYGARYLDPTGAMWLSVDPMWEKNIDATPYNYCHGNPIKLMDPDGRADIDAVDFIPIAGSGRDIYQGVKTGDGVTTTIGVVFLVVDIVSLGSGSAVTAPIKAGIKKLFKCGVKATAKSAAETTAKTAAETTVKSAAETTAKTATETTAKESTKSIVKTTTKTTSKELEKGATEKSVDYSKSFFENTKISDEAAIKMRVDKTHGFPSSVEAFEKKMELDI
ncbi:MAG: RHS repeat-associated core domain-containing protein [Paludibacteraceae bacterium]|nr:RHS repeat-associated core domain-containing protein [Paludibacteraceae bacterium]